MSDRRHDKRGIVGAWAERCFGWQIHSFILLNEQTEGETTNERYDSTSLHRKEAFFGVVFLKDRGLPVVAPKPNVEGVLALIETLF